MIVAVRHGPVAAAGICYGRWNPPLVNPPETDAGTILEALAGVPTGAASAAVPAGDILRIVSSPADRCRQIATPLAARLGLELHEDQRIAELSMGDWEGKPWHWIEQHDGERLQRWMEQWQTAAPPGGESLADLEARVRAAGDATVGPGRTLWITHAGVIRTLRVVLCGSTWPAAMQAKVPHLAPEPFVVGG